MIKKWIFGVIITFLYSKLLIQFALLIALLVFATVSKVLIKSHKLKVQYITMVIIEILLLVVILFKLLDY